MGDLGLQARTAGALVVLVCDGRTTVDNAVLSAAQISVHHNATLTNISSFGPRVTLALAAEVTFQ